jgi:Ca-activated chloride channel family protein
MRRPWIICGLLTLTLFVPAGRADSQTKAADAQTPATYNLSVSVDEVLLTFHADDAHGLPINDLKLDELRLLDNRKPPRKILAFQSLQNRPIRAGILMDKSESMEQDLPGNRDISSRYIQRMLRQQTDQAFIMDFASLSQIAQPWTSDTIALTTGLHRFIDIGSRTHGTAIFDALYRACLNFILLFSDGEDNAGQVSLAEAVGECQHTNTAIYALQPKSRSGSAGPDTLAQLTSETGGRVFYADDSESGIDNDLQMIEADLRDQYRLIYRPAELKRNGSFHHVELTASERVDRIIVRSGYYAPTH